jgi:hypothetical protein
VPGVAASSARPQLAQYCLLPMTTRSVLPQDGHCTKDNHLFTAYGTTFVPGLGILLML